MELDRAHSQTPLREPQVDAATHYPARYDVLAVDYEPVSIAMSIFFYVYGEESRRLCRVGNL
jgi:hypothetical protein